MDRETEAKVALAQQIAAGVLVAAGLARLTGRAHAVDLTADGTCGTNGPADLPPRDGFERAHVVEPEAIPEDPMGLAKTLYTSRCQGGTIPEPVLRVFAAHLVRPARGGTKHETEAALDAHLSAGPRGRPPDPAPPPGPPAVKPAAAQRSLFD